MSLVNEFPAGEGFIMLPPEESTTSGSSPNMYRCVLPDGRPIPVIVEYDEALAEWLGRLEGRR